MSGQPPSYGSDFTLRFDDAKGSRQSAVESKQDPYEHYDTPEVGDSKPEIGSSSYALSRDLSRRSSTGPSNDMPMDGSDGMRDAPKFPEPNAETGYAYGASPASHTVVDDNAKDTLFAAGTSPNPARSSRYQDLGECPWCWLSDCR